MALHGLCQGASLWPRWAGGGGADTFTGTGLAD